MANLKVSDELHQRTLSFKKVVDALLDEQLSLDEYVELIVFQGINSLLSDILGSSDVNTLVNSIQQLGARYPDEVYGFMAETLKLGMDVEQQKRMRQRLGFRPGENV